MWSEYFFTSLLNKCIKETTQFPFPTVSISLQIFYRLSSTNFTSSVLEYFVQNITSPTKFCNIQLHFHFIFCLVRTSIRQALAIIKEKRKALKNSFSASTTVPSSILSEVVVQRCSVKKLVLNILQDSQENNCVRVSLLIKLQV